MHPNPAFRTKNEALNLDFARKRGFGILSINGAAGPLVSHVPLLLSDDGATADFHLVRSNPIAREVKEPVPAVFALSGGDSYISPDWYGIEDQVPTWNYVAMHLRGNIAPLPADDLRGLIEALSAHFEERLLPKAPWLSEKMTEGLMERMMRQIVPYRLTIASVDGTWKLGQNKPDSARLGAARAVAEAGIGQELAWLAALMEEPPALG